MSNNDWVNRATKQHISGLSPGDMALRFGGSFVGVDGNAVSTQEWLFNPDLSAVVGFDSKYWITSNAVVKLLPQAARDAIDATELITRRDSVANGLDEAEGFSRAFALVVLDELNLLRSQHGLPSRTIGQMKAEVRNKLGNDI